VQTEDFDSRYVPVAIGYELYRGQQKIPGLTVNCEVSGTIVCTGVSGAHRAAASAPYKLDKPFWLWMDGVTSIDVAWQFENRQIKYRHSQRVRWNRSDDH
jgi:hypothetical protein